MEYLVAGKEADVEIQEELRSAGIHVIGQSRDISDNFSFGGRLGYWEFNRTAVYWAANAPRELGLPLNIATELNEKGYPITGEKQPKTYGNIIRVAGNSGGSDPKEWAFPPEEIVAPQLIALGKENRVSSGELAKLCNDGKIVGSRFVNCYHIDTQEGLNELARVIRKLGI